MFLPYFLYLRKRRLTAAIVVLVLAASGCASSGRVRAQQDDLDAMKKQFADLKSQVGTLGTRLDAVEGKMTALTSPPPQPAGGLQGTAVTPHPADGIGTSPERVAASGDPEPGFVNDEPVREYRKAMLLFEAGRYADASVGFATFLEKYPDHPFAGSAQFYVGRSYLRQKDYKQAYDEYQRVLTTYDRSSHITETLHDLAETEEQLHKVDDAARHRQLLSSLFPQSPAYATLTPSAPAPAPAPVRAPVKQDSTPTTPTGRATQLDEPPPPAASFAPPMPTTPGAVPPTAPVERVVPKAKPDPQPGDLYPAAEGKS
jgi:TolA-binding protein